MNEWNPNKNTQGEEEVSQAALKVNETDTHTGALSLREIIQLLQDEKPHERFQYYKRVVRTVQQHDYHGPPNPSQPCAQLLKGTLNLCYCDNGYPRDLVCVNPATDPSLQMPFTQSSGA